MSVRYLSMKYFSSLTNNYKKKITFDQETTQSPTQ